MTTLFEQSEALPAPAPAPAPPPVVPLKGVGEDDWLDASFKERKNLKNELGGFKKTQFYGNFKEVFRIWQFWRVFRYYVFVFLFGANFDRV